MNHSLPITLALSCCSLFLQGQDIEQSIKEAKKTLKEDPASMSGAIGASAVAYKSFGIDPRRDPFYWVVNANLTFNLFNKISLPFTAVITQQDKNLSHDLDKFSQPFNQFGISPRYRWLTVHAGFRSVEFSEYTLSGAMFLGGGVEVRPEKSLITGSAVYGRFVKAIPKGGVDGIVVSLPAYDRWGGGAKVKLGDEINFAELIVLKIKDDPNSIPFDTSLVVTPQENQIVAIGLKKKLKNWINFSGDLSYSMFTKNTFQEITKIESFTYVNQIYDPRPSSQFNKALNFSLDMTPGKSRLGLKYKRIDPDYRSLGSIFLTNDVEEISANANQSFLKNKVNASVAIGLQRNNLDKIQLMTSQRVIGSLNLNYNISPNLNLNASYSNFSSNTLPVRDAFTDSIKFVQLTQNGGITAMFSFGKSKAKQNITNAFSYQESGGNQMALNTFVNETVSYNVSIPETGLAINFSGIYNKTINGFFGINKGYGPNFGIQKTFFKSKLRFAANFGYQDNYLNSKLSSRNMISSFSADLSIDKHQSFKIDCNYLEKSAIDAAATQFSEIRGNISYNYQFGLKKKNFTKLQS